MSEKIKMFLNTRKDEDNLTLEVNDEYHAFYSVDGFLSEDGFVHTFEDPAKFKKLTLQDPNILTNIDMIDLDFMLTFYVTLLKDTHLETYEFSSSKMTNLIKISDKFYEVPLKETTRTPYSTLTKILFKNVYAMQFNNGFHLVGLPIKQIIDFLFKKQSAVKNDTILVNSKYDDFREELGKFQRKYNVEFEHSEGTEMMVSLMYVVIKYLKVEWKHIYKLLK